jgi:LDH2 family malate/lactate/ureidoglycolate dehydrogenase
MLTGLQDGKKVPYHLGHFFIAIDTEAFMGLESFKKTAGNILRELRASEKAPGCERIYTAGEKEYLVWLERKDRGLPVNESVQKELIAIRDALKLDNYRFPLRTDKGRVIIWTLKREQCRSIISGPVSWR